MVVQCAGKVSMSGRSRGGGGGGSLGSEESLPPDKERSTRMYEKVHYYSLLDSL